MLCDRVVLPVLCCVLAVVFWCWLSMLCVARVVLCDLWLCCMICGCVARVVLCDAPRCPAFTTRDLKVLEHGGESLQFYSMKVKAFRFPLDCHLVESLQIVT